MNPCARGCCWTPFSCAADRTCRCHAAERRPAAQGSDYIRHRDPTANTAIRNLMNRRNK